MQLKNVLGVAVVFMALLVGYMNRFRPVEYLGLLVLMFLIVGYSDQLTKGKK